MKKNKWLYGACSLALVNVVQANQTVAIDCSEQARANYNAQAREALISEDTDLFKKAFFKSIYCVNPQDYIRLRDARDPRIQEIENGLAGTT